MRLAARNIAHRHPKIVSAVVAGMLSFLTACGGGGGDGNTAGPPPGGGNGGGGNGGGGNATLTQQIEQAKAEILADTCFRQPVTTACNWGEHTFSAQDFSMAQNTGEAVLVIDEFFSKPPLLSVRYGNRIKGIFQVSPGGAIAPMNAPLRAPATLLSVLKRFATPKHISAQQLQPLLEPIETMYGGLNIVTPGHGTFVLSLLIDTNPHQPFVLLQSLSLAKIARTDYCDASGSADAQGRLLGAAQNTANQLTQLMRDNNVRFVNYSAGHTLPVIRDEWPAVCGTATPGDDVLRTKLQAYAPIYTALFNTPGVLAAHASDSNSSPSNYPYDYPSAAYPNRLRVGYFTALESGLDAVGKGNYSVLDAWPGIQNVDLYVNTGVLPTRPFNYNRTPLLQADQYGVAMSPITGPQPSWVAPLALSRFIHLRYATFAGRDMNNALIADIFDAAMPAQCPGLPGGRCLYQDPLLHGQIESVRLGYRSRLYP